VYCASAPLRNRGIENVRGETLRSHILTLISINPFASFDMAYVMMHGIGYDAPNFKHAILNIRS
jgi:hypothetical protein